MNRVGKIDRYEQRKWCQYEQIRQDRYKQSRWNRVVGDVSSVGKGLSNGK